MNGKIKLAAGREMLMLMLMLMEEDFLDLMESPLATRELQTTTCNQLSILSLQEPCSRRVSDSMVGEALMHRVSF
jgi:hypothetical protein